MSRPFNQVMRALDLLVVQSRSCGRVVRPPLFSESFLTAAQTSGFLKEAKGPMGKIPCTQRAPNDHTNVQVSGDPPVLGTFNQNVGSSCSYYLIAYSTTSYYTVSYFHIPSYITSYYEIQSSETCLMPHPKLMHPGGTISASCWGGHGT